MTLLGVFGSGGCGRGILPIVRAQMTAGDELLFVDDDRSITQVNGHAVIGLDDFAAYPAAMRSLIIAVAAPATRRHIAERAIARGIGFFSARAAQSVIMDDVTIGPGSAISPYCVMTSNIRIGSHFHCNIGSHVEHDCEIGNFVTFAPGVLCNGNVVIGDGAYLGAGAIIKQGRPGAPLSIGAGSTIGMGAVVTRDVPPDTVVVGNPARPMMR